MSSSGQGRRVGLISLGCPKNRVDSEQLLGQFLQQGYSVTADATEADLLVVNTCGFKADAEEESRAAILEMAALKERYPGKRLLVTGCLSQRYGHALAEQIPAIDLLVGSAQYDRLLPLLALQQREGKKIIQVEAPGPPLPLRPAVAGQQAEERTDLQRESLPAAAAPAPAPQRLLTTLPHSAYVKIAEGCNNSCSFCIIPQLRGRFRSRPPEEILAEVQALAAQGVLEINLVSQDSTLYGRDLQPRSSLAALLRLLAKVEGVAWIRTLYLYPTLVTTELLQVMAEEEKIVPYLDIPLQHAHSAVLTRMRRAERAEDIQRLLQQIDHYLPQATLRTTFIVGFPGESAAEFAQLLDLVGQEWFDHVGVFTYSDELGCSAYGLPDKVDAALAEERRQQLLAKQQPISRRKLRRWLGKKLEVLVEQRSAEHSGLMLGRSKGQAPEIDGVVYINAGQPPAGTLLPVIITESHEYDLVGHPAALRVQRSPSRVNSRKRIRQ
ncbi:30S ribosomal protein S12 methylthiotransferase RimO [Candidatus Magnetaquicoccus inordinatus]|uniref:30S ribosomal protein S12 methylthiotransferase RimO n=1 Tax=Candidatus Magnetaquicoccus inordinatus TaxID=2496818 RepID=UPI00102B79C0|nr:30S ribosomal protein S12 methylthiotransferase RimO [Candidatus Magnetaquicoccus inordinatus]